MMIAVSFIFCVATLSGLIAGLGRRGGGGYLNKRDELVARQLSHEDFIRERSLLRKTYFKVSIGTFFLVFILFSAAYFIWGEVLIQSLQIGSKRS